MRHVSATDAKQRLAALLDAAQREPVVIRRQKRDVAVLVSAHEYDRLRAFNVEEFQQFCDRVAGRLRAASPKASWLRFSLNPFRGIPIISPASYLDW